MCLELPPRGSHVGIRLTLLVYTCDIAGSWLAVKACYSCNRKGRVLMQTQIYMSSLYALLCAWCKYSSELLRAEALGEMESIRAVHSNPASALPLPLNCLCQNVVWLYAWGSYWLRWCRWLSGYLYSGASLWKLGLRCWDSFLGDGSTTWNCNPMPVDILVSPSE